jgi:hypothetical protein
MSLPAPGWSATMVDAITIPDDQVDGPLADRTSRGCADFPGTADATTRRSVGPSLIICWGAGDLGIWVGPGIDTLGPFGTTPLGWCVVSGYVVRISWESRSSGYVAASPVDW